MASVMILRRMGLCRLVEFALLTFAGKVGEALEARFRPLLEEGETMPSFGMVLTLFARFLQDCRSRLSATDISRLDELDGNVEVREDLSEAINGVRQLLINSRDTIRSVYGDLALKRLGFQGRTAREAIALLQQGRRVLANLGDPLKLEGLTPRVKATVDLAGMAAELAGALELLQGLADDIAVERRKATETKIEKDTTMDFFDDLFIPMARVVEGMFHVGGFSRLARRIRPASSSRIGRPEVDTGSLEGLEPSPEESPGPQGPPESEGSVSPLPGAPPSG